MQQGPVAQPSPEGRAKAWAREVDTRHPQGSRSLGAHWWQWDLGPLVLPATYRLTGSRMPLPQEPRPRPSFQPIFCSIWKPTFLSVSFCWAKSKSLGFCGETGTSPGQFS